MNNEATGALIRELRKEKKMTQKELAQHLHVTDRAVSKWERGLCAPDIALLEPLAQILGTTVLGIVSGTRAEQQAHAEQIENAVKEALQYSEQEIARKGKTLRKRSLLAVLGVCLMLLMLPALNGTIFGEGFAWRCIPAWLCAREAAQALEQYDEEGIERTIGNADGVYEALTQLKEQGVVIRNARARLSRTQLDDMFLFTELELTVQQEHITYLFTCQGAWRNGKVEWMQIYVPSVGYDGPAWVPQLSEAIATYYPG